ncbi:MAG: bifunctional ADP-dependent (S)-NAD(P)H-hydrate dehydratase/NAD(P)H-hydrate epimerase [Sphingomonas bacterium]|uniref:NAD(P)H-hydrate dehydratase n=1 Tax=Sphingomonas bacterium TaxID=1895847 RepID=UPI00260459BE|nr:NAD(P)H-hydrate dehydratase [Sphingomonas bacterium]MDB5704654.1 bifunctional ADP-dependent (S)-NAD(P)H-hydrate dehydratase/NAD(P)H-hydrate epimerase [Sphingomonas bacterium]
MTPLSGQPILTAAQMRAAEQAAIDQGASVDSLMARAGREVAEAVRRLASAAPILILCGPGNNGGDGYVVARALEEGGLSVRVAASGPPGTDAARTARAGWAGPVESLGDTESAPILVDALFGTGLSRPLDAAIVEPFGRLVAEARLSIAVDLPSGISTDDGAVLGTVPEFDLTLALGSAKPAHLLQPAARFCGKVRILDIGIHIDGDAFVLGRPALASPGPDAHKYARGMVAVVGGRMPGAAELAAESALRAGAGYVLLLDGAAQGNPHAIVRRTWNAGALDDPRIGALLVGPGLGRDEDARVKLDHVLASRHRLVIDGDALHLLDEERLAILRARETVAVLTPHAGEFAALFGKPVGSKIDAARDAAKRSGAFVVFKGADTVIAVPGGAVLVAEAANDWLSTAGSGDVLAGAIAATLSSGGAPIAAIGAGVWLHGDAARRLGAAFIADDLAHALSAARAAL